MNKILESLLKRTADWPPVAQEEATAALVGIEQRLTDSRPLGPDERAARLADLRTTIIGSIERGGSHTDEDVDARITERLDALERESSRR